MYLVESQIQMAACQLTTHSIIHQYTNDLFKEKLLKSKRVVQGIGF